MNARSLYFNRGESTSADAPTREDGLSDERILGIACHEADALDATRVNEIKDGAWKATTMMEDSALIRFARHILRAGHAARGDEARDAEKWLNLLRGYRKMVNAVAPHFDKPITDENIVHWLNLNNAGATIDAAIAAMTEREAE